MSDTGMSIKLECPIVNRRSYGSLGQMGTARTAGPRPHGHSHRQRLVGTYIITVPASPALRALDGRAERVERVSRGGFMRVYRRPSTAIVRGLYLVALFSASAAVARAQD